MAMAQRNRPQRGHDFLPEATERAAIPGQYGQEEVPTHHAIIYLHYYSAGSHWWIAELWQGPHEPGRWQAYGYLAIHPEDTPLWDRISLTELEHAYCPTMAHPRDPPPGRPACGGVHVQRDLHWKPHPTHECLPALTPDTETKG